MSPLVYLTTMKAKNRFIDLLHKPLKLVLTIGFIVLLVMNFSVSQGASFGERSLQEFKAIIFVFYLLCFITETKKGFHSGGTMFSMADANLLFMSPLKPVMILFHGMLGRLGSSLIMGLAFIYQFALLRSFYPVNLEDMLVAVIGYGAVVFVSQLAGMLIYFYTCGDENRIKKAKTVFYSVCSAFGVLFSVSFVSSGSFTFFSAARLLTSLPMRFFPVAGWVFTSVDGVMLSDVIKITAGTVPSVVFTVAVFVIIAFSRHGYYEDVLLSAEKNADKKAEDGVKSVIISSGATGQMKKGRGASAVFYKHLLENRRTKPFFITSTSLFYLVLIGIYGFVFKSGFVSLFTLSCTVSVLSVMSGRWLKELTMPYVYLIPEPPVKKLFFLIPELIPVFFTESLLQCALIGLISGFGIITVATMIFARMAFCFLLTSSALFVAGIMREKEKNNVFAAICVLTGGLFSLPSIVLSVVLTGYGMGLIIGFIAMGIVNVTVSILLLFFARRLLDFSE